MYSRIAQFLSASWLIHHNEITTHLPLLVSFLNGNKISLSDFGDDKKANTPYILGMQPNAVPSYSGLDDPNIPENSVAIIPIQGVLYDAKTLGLINNIRMAGANPNISAILFMVNSPGGMVFMTDIAAQTIKDCQLPTVAFVMNMAASAAMWLISACDYIVASSPLDSFGSIGTRTSFMDINGLLKEKLGITVYDIYATKSTHKDHEIRTLLEGDNTALTERLDFANEMFHAAIRQNLGIAEDSEVFAGDMYRAQRAIDLGLAHKIASFDDALQMAHDRGVAYRMKTLFNNY